MDGILISNETLTIISIITGIASVVLAVIAIWFALHTKSEADKTNKETQNLLIEIRTDAKAISQVTMPELQAYGNTMRQLLEKNVEELTTSINKDHEKKVKLLDTIQKEDDLSKVRQEVTKLREEIDQSKQELLAKIRASKAISVNQEKGITIGDIINRTQQEEIFKNAMERSTNRKRSARRS